MKPTYFSNKKSLEIVSNDIRNNIKSLITNIGSFNLTSKYYTFLNKKNVNNLKENNFLVSLSTFGKKFILFITKYNTKKYCIFINKKNDVMTVTQLKFEDDIFNGTLFDGELVKNDNNKWIFLINDIAYYKGDNIITKTFKDRELIIDNILKNEYQNEDCENQSFYIAKKQYFPYNNIKDLSETYMDKLNYKCSGLYFKNTNNYSDNYLFIFPECRSDSKILGQGLVGQGLVGQGLVGTVDDNDDLFKDVDIIRVPKITEEIHIVAKPLQNTKQNPKKLEKITCKFKIQKTVMPDIYELYCYNDSYMEKYSYASVPDMETSNFIKSLFIDSKNDTDIFVECNYHKSFKKWIPYKKTDSSDLLNTINQIQIILDSV
jgi:hypothetical protein